MTPSNTFLEVVVVVLVDVAFCEIVHGTFHSALMEWLLLLGVINYHTGQ